MMLFLQFLPFLGGLGMFLFGMNLMGEGLEKRAGAGLKNVLSKMTAGRFRGLLLGLVVTAAIQSSSAVTVMVVGFVNSGVMTLGQSIGVIMGANVGTTLTAWLLSLTGVEGGNFFLNLLKPSSFTPVLAVIGVVLFLFLKKDRQRSLGLILLGFTVLIYGMEKMSDSVAPLAEMPGFGELLLAFQNPILGVLAGALVTAIVQSSSASIGILQALTATGGLTYASVIPIIMGQNIGTCVTSLLSGIGTNQNAKRASVVHLYFNVIGTLIGLVGFWLMKRFFVLSFLSDPVLPVSVAVVHTVFNLLTTILLFPFAKQIEALVVLSVHDKSAKNDTPWLDQRLLATPAIALERAREVTQSMANLAFENVEIAVELLHIYKEDFYSRLERSESEVDRMEDEIGSFLVLLRSRGVSEEDGVRSAGLLRVIGDLERISDHAVKLGEAARELSQKNLRFSNEGEKELSVLFDALDEMIGLTKEVFLEGGLSRCACAEPLEERIQTLQKEIRVRHINRLGQQGENMVVGFILSDLLNEAERISNHCVNIIGCMVEVSERRMQIHSFFKESKTRHTQDYQKWVNIYAKRYAFVPK